MTKHFDPNVAQAAAVQARRRRGALSNQKGLAAEESVLRRYNRSGAQLLAQRWRGMAGEIDLVFRDDTGLVFVEVKCADRFERAIQSLSAKQIARICTAAQEFADTQPDGMLSFMRFDLAVVDGQGNVKVLDNAFGEF